MTLFSEEFKKNYILRIRPKQKIRKQVQYRAAGVCTRILAWNRDCAAKTTFFASKVFDRNML